MSTNNLNNKGQVQGDMIGTQVNNYFEKKYSKIPSILTELIKQLASIDEEDENNDVDVSPYNPEEKIEFNHVIKYKEILMEYTKFYINCDNILNSIDNYNPGRKNKILKSVKIIYDKTVGEIMLSHIKANRIEIVRNNSDMIIELVERELRQRIENDSISESLTQEDVDIGLLIFICYAFNKCKVLEKPDKET